MSVNENVTNSNDLKHNNLKTLFQVEENKKRKIIYKPQSDSIFQPLFLIFIFFGAALFLIAYFINAFCFYHYAQNEIMFKDAGAILATAAALIGTAFIIRSFRALDYLFLNKGVKLKDIDSHLIYRFSNRFILYVSLALFVIMICLLSANDFQIYHAGVSFATYLLMNPNNTIFVTGVFAILAASVFMAYLFSKLIRKNIDFIKKNFIKKQTPDSQDYEEMQKRRANQSFIKCILRNIMVWTALTTGFVLGVSFFIFGANMLKLSDLNSLASTTLVLVAISVYVKQFTIAMFIVAGMGMIAWVFTCFAYAINTSIVNANSYYEQKQKNERERIARIDEKYRLKMLKKQKN